MDTEIQIALLGILGTLGGTILGWILNSISQKGKLHVYISSWKESFTYNKDGSMILSSSIEQTQCYNYKLSIDLYNSSGETRIMRDASIIFANNKNILFKSTPKDDDTIQVKYRRAFFDDISPINIPAKSVINLNLHDGVWKKDDSLDFIWKTNCVYFTYKDERNRVKRIQIKKEAYTDYFKNHKLEDCA